MFAGDSVLEILYKEIVDGLYGKYKLMPEGVVKFEVHYVDGDLVNFDTDTKPDFKEAVDQAIKDNTDQYRFTDLTKVGDNTYTFSGMYTNAKSFEFSFVKEEGKWVKESIVLI
jgi:hypothetical protein